MSLIKQATVKQDEADSFDTSHCYILNLATWHRTANSFATVKEFILFVVVSAESSVSKKY